jgi:hypothetical protein
MFTLRCRQGDIVATVLLSCVGDTGDKLLLVSFLLAINYRQFASTGYSPYTPSNANLFTKKSIKSKSLFVIMDRIASLKLFINSENAY